MRIRSKYHYVWCWHFWRKRHEWSYPEDLWKTSWIKDERRKAGHHCQSCCDADMEVDVLRMKARGEAVELRHGR